MDRENAMDRETTIVRFIPLVRVVAARMARRFPSHVDLDELVNAGTLGLIDAVDRFDPERGVPFQSYAELRIRGAIIDALREADWVPRAVRKRATRMETARTDLRARLGRDPSGEEVATELGLAPAEYERQRDRSEVRRLVSLDTPLDDDGDARLGDSVADPEEGLLERWITAEDGEAIRAAIEGLPERERLVVTLYYLRGRALKEIAGSLGVSEARISQLRAQGIRRLRGRLGVEEQ